MSSVVVLLWLFPSGRRRPSVRVGFPWLFALCAWVGVARAAVDHATLRRPGPAAWAAWLAVGAIAVPVVVALVSRLVGVPVSLRALAWTAVAAGVATAGSLAVLFPDFAGFAFVGGFLVAGVATSTYAVGTSRDLEAWRDGHLP